MYPIAFLILSAVAILPHVAMMSECVRRAGLPILRPDSGLFATFSYSFAMFTWVTPGPSEMFSISLTFLALALLAWGWAAEFARLGLSADAFSARFDKLMWAALFVFSPPVGMIAFGVFRRAYWTAAKHSADVSMHELA